MIRADKAVPSNRLSERQYVELPLLRQLAGQGWSVLDLEFSQLPEATGCGDLTEVVLLPRLRDALVRLNPWIETDQVDLAVDRLTRGHPPAMLEANRHVLELLLSGTPLDENRRTGAKSPNVRFVDFEHAANNDLLAVCQFKVRIPGTDAHILPDVVLFVNGLPVVVIECKAPGVADGLDQALDQIRRYAEQRGEEREGHRGLFGYNAFVVLTNRDKALYGTITSASLRYCHPWSDPYPRTLEELAAEVQAGQSGPNAQHRLAAGMLDPQNLLDLIRSFTAFIEPEGGGTVKVVGRYQQFRAVKKAVAGLANGQNRAQRSGIVWHTQGSGKSLTMVYLVREMHRHPQLQGWKIVFVTDRTELEAQLTSTTQAIGKTVHVANSVAKLQALLPGQDSGLVMAMIHKFQPRELEVLFPELNPRSDLLVLTDEAHRTQYGLLAANLDRALPNATEIGFTGTPIEKTEKKYGDYIDKYTMREAIDDEVTLAIVYEGRTHRAEVSDPQGADQRFADVFDDLTIEQRLRALGYAGRDAYLEAEPTIREKARDMVRHYTEHVFPNGFKAQVVATSQEAAYRYGLALRAAFEERAAALEEPGANPLAVKTDRLRRLRVAVVVSGVTHNDRPHIKALGSPAQHRRDIEDFKRPFDAPGEGGLDGNVGVLVVNNMLLTGFDAPIEQVLYLDRVITAHNLLQAIARVNRAGPMGKDRGFVVDYVGVGANLKRALDVYAEREQKEILEALHDPAEELQALRDAHAALAATVAGMGVEDPTDLDAYFAAFYDETARAGFLNAFETFTRAFNTVLPRKEALDYLEAFLRYTEVAVQARQHLSDDRFSLRGVPVKLRAIADVHLASKGIEQGVAPIPILDDAFAAEVGAGSAKSRAARKASRTRAHITERLPDDPELYASFAAELERILAEHGQNWARINEELDRLRERIRQAAQEPTYGLSRRRQMPVFRVLRARLFGESPLTDAEIGTLVPLTQEVTDTLAAELRLPGFWTNPVLQAKLRGELVQLLLRPEHASLKGMTGRYKELVTAFVEFARHNTDTLLYAP
jgi:type I restriction enzyme, R subunit